MTDQTENEKLRHLMKDRYERPLAKRFYKTVSLSDANAILLDGRAVKTPLKAPLVLPSRAMAEAVAAEWEAQHEVINTALMPMTRLANTAIDRASLQRDNLIREILVYANADVVCYRAIAPEELVALQKQHWDPALAWTMQRLDAIFVVTPGVNHIDQPAASLAAIERMISTLTDFQMTAIYNMVTLLGSAILPLMQMERAASPDAVWASAHVDEDFQISQWSWDNEARTRREYRRSEYDAYVRFLELAA